MENFTPFSSLLGGILIGLSAAALLLFNGKIAGISGIVGGLLSPTQNETAWRLMFLAGLISGGLLMVQISPHALSMDVPRSATALLVAGVLVGFGTRLGNGCTSGHGVCGMSRGSARSFVATAVFMLTGMLTVYVVNHILGGKL